MKYNYSAPSEIYCAPFIANGAVSLQIGPDGSMNKLPGGSIIKANPTGSIWWEGRRHVGKQTKPLLPFGRFTDSTGAKPLEAEQELNPRTAEVSCKAVYPDCTVETVAFIDADSNLITLRKRIAPKKPTTYSFTYTLADKDSDKLPPFFSCESSSLKNGGRISYSLCDRVGYSGTISLASDSDCKVEAGANSVTLNFDVTEARDFTLYLYLTDSLDSENPLADAEKTLAKTLAEGYESVRARHSKAWADYYAEGSAETGDELLDRVYLTAQYHLKCFTTKWSLPVGLNDSTWDGRFFGFDEHYMQMGLLSSNHIEASRHVPEFRKKYLWIATARGSSRHHKAAHYPWETIEDGTEASPPGFYYDHIFHMAAIPLSGWEYYRYTRDEDLLRETVYPVLSGCAEFFRIHNLYRIEGGKLIVGKCTDLERLGSSVQNPYMTTCGVIATLRAYSEASRILGVNLELADECDRLAADLKAGLPNDGKRYVPYPGCDDRSISAFSGTHPFDVIDRDDPLQLQAIADYLEYEDTFGNMYEMGSGVCSWYACWKGVVYDRLGRASDAFDALRYVASTAGDFGELFEINNAPSRTYRCPWFTTAAGMYIHAVNEALVQGDAESGLELLKGVEESATDVRFRLAARGGIIVECEVSGGELTRLELYANEFCRAETVEVRLPERLGGARAVKVTQ